MRTRRYMISSSCSLSMVLVSVVSSVACRATVACIAANVASALLRAWRSIRKAAVACPDDPAAPSWLALALADCSASSAV